MSSLLERIPEQQTFTPSSVEEYLALQIAKRLGDEASIADHIRHVERVPAQHLVPLFHRARKESDAAQVFHSSLMKSHP